MHWHLCMVICCPFPAPLYSSTTESHKPWRKGGKGVGVVNHVRSGRLRAAVEKGVKTGATCTMGR